MKLLSLSFFAEIWPHSYPEFLIYKSLNEKYNFDIDYLSCESFFQSCMVHDSRQESYSSSKVKKKICKLCIDTKNQYSNNFNNNTLIINDFLSKQNLLDIEIILENVNHKNFMNLKVFDVEISRFTLFNYFISQKKSGIKFEKNEFERFKIRLKDSLKSLYAFKNIISKKKYDYIIAFSTEYSLNRVCVEYAKKKGIKILNIGNGKHTVSKFKFIKISEGYDQGLYYHANQKWKDFSKKSLISENFNYVREYIHSFLGAKTFMNYSSKYTGKNIREYFKIDKRYKKIVLVALSSQDERSGDFFSKVRQSSEKKCYSNLFKDDLEWCEWLLNKIDLFQETYFIVRFHPRSFPSSRNREKSDLIDKINKISSIRKKNLSFNFPTDPVSVYDYLGEINLLLQSSSSISFEFGLFGIPNISYDKKLYYFSDELTFTTRNLTEYIDKIHFLLNEKNYDKQKIVINAFRWLIIQLNYEFVDISDAFDPPSANSEKNIFFKYMLKFFNKFQKIAGINLIVRYLILNIKLPKKTSLLIDIFLKNLKSNLDITINFDEISSDDKKDFEKCKLEMLNILRNYKKLSNLYYKL